MKHLFQSENLARYIQQSEVGFLSEKLDGSNIAVTSNRVVASRRHVLLKNPTASELSNFKFSGVALGKLVGVFDKLDRVKEIFEKLFPFLELEVIVYGELIQRGTANCKTDRYNYREKGICEGDVKIFGCGISFGGKLNNDQSVKAKNHLMIEGFGVILETHELSSYCNFVLPMNDKLYQLLSKCNFELVMKHQKIKLIDAVTDYADKLKTGTIEGIVINFGEEIMKWKSSDSSYPPLFIDQIENLKQSLDTMKIFESLQQVANESIKKLKMNKTLSQLENAFNSAMSKYNFSFDESLSGEQASILTKILRDEMMKDCYDEEYRKAVDFFIQNKSKALK